MMPGSKGFCPQHLIYSNVLKVKVSSLQGGTFILLWRK